MAFIKKLTAGEKPMSKEKLKTQTDKGLTGTVPGNAMLWRKRGRRIQ